MLELSITPKAESDLVGIWVYTCGEWGIEQADEYLDKLEQGMKQLIHHPSMGARVEHHAVFYRVLEREILVVRVLHEDMDAPEWLLE